MVVFFFGLGGCRSFSSSIFASLTCTNYLFSLKEEIDIPQHLSQAMAKSVGGQHPNVLAYVDSWKQDEALHIQTELHELGTFALFLGEFGRKYPRLDETWVWKIFVDISNVSIIRHQ